MLLQEIPITSGVRGAHQTFSVSLNNKLYNMKLDYRTITKTWSLTVRDNEGELICAGVRLVKGCNLLRTYHISDTFGGLCILGQEPTLDNLGDSSKLVWAFDDEANS